MVLEQDTFILAYIVLVQPRKTRPCLTERLLMGRKESNQTKIKQVSDGLKHPIFFSLHLYSFMFHSVGIQESLRADLNCHMPIIFQENKVS